MKPIAFALLIAGAGFATVNAAPIRVVTVVSSYGPNVPHILSMNPGQFNGIPQGAAPFPPYGPNVPHILPMNPGQFNGIPQAVAPFPQNVRPCGGMRNKAMRFSDAFRQLFGFPVIGTPQQHEHNDVRFMPASVGRRPQFHPEPGRFIPMGFSGVEEQHRHHLDAFGRPMEHHHNAHHHKHKGFPKRIMHAFKTLRWWEGSVVAFVFGCGIGVLLRLFWVLAVVSYRAVAGGESSVCNEAEDEQEETVSLIAPPLYSEKMPILEDKKVDESA